MTLALTVFGVSGDSLPPVFCYALLRSVRGPGEYPAPTLPSNVSPTTLKEAAITGTLLKLLTWDMLIPQGDEDGWLRELDAGRLTIPPGAPVAGGTTISGAPIGLLIVEEGTQRASVTGAGFLLRKGIAADAPLKALEKALEEALPPGTMPGALLSIIKQIASMSGLEEVLKDDRAIGIVDYFFREPASGLLEGPLFDIAPDRGDPRKRTAMQKVFIRRHAASNTEPYQLSVRLKNHDETFSVTMMNVPVNVDEVTVHTPMHITDASVVVFNQSGKAVDIVNAKFLQGMHFGLSVIGKSDSLPPAFPGAPKSSDLEARPRISTLSFDGPAMPGWSGGLDVLRKQKDALGNVVGPIVEKPENVWFERGVEGQLGVIRWIKDKIENAETTKAFFVDPYLGSDALQRIVARQGNESVDLQILVSPGRANPDAEEAAAEAEDDYLTKLKETANGWSDKLAGRISITHIKRGDATRQAFHDRFLCTLNRKNVPTVYLLSNSLSKAAGNWPFAVCELDRVLSWRIYTYIDDLLNGRISGAAPELIWQKSSDPDQGQFQAEAAAQQTENEEPWLSPARVLLGNIQKVIIRNNEFKASVAALLDAFLQNWPEGLDEERFAKALFGVVRHRDKIVVFVADYLRNNGRATIANALEDQLVSEALQQVPQPGERSNWFIPFEERVSVLRTLGQAIARKAKATNFVRDQLNSRVHTLISALETQRLDGATSWDALESALFLCVIALQVAIASTAKVEHRVGLANDYIHWLGRLARSNEARAFTEAEVPGWSNDLRFAAAQILQARAVLGPDLDKSIQRVMSDPLVSPILKMALGTTDGQGVVHLQYDH